MALLVYEPPVLRLSYTKTAHLVYEPPVLRLSYTKTGLLVYEPAFFVSLWI